LSRNETRGSSHQSEEWKSLEEIDRAQLLLVEKTLIFVDFMSFPNKQMTLLKQRLLKSFTIEDFEKPILKVFFQRNLPEV